MASQSMPESRGLPARNDPEGLWNPYVAGVALGLVLFAAFFITGSGLGGSAGFARLAAFIQAAVAPGSADTSAYLAPMAGGGRNPLDNNMVWMTLGVIAGGFTSGWLGGRVKVETLKGRQIDKRTRHGPWPCWVESSWGSAPASPAAAPPARPCRAAVLSVGSWAFMIMVFAGAYMLAYPLRKLWN